MGIFENAAAVEKLGLCLALFGSIAEAVLFIWDKLHRKNRKAEDNDPSGEPDFDILKYPADKLVKPYVPRLVTAKGTAGFFIAAGFVCMILGGSGIPFPAVILIAMFLGISCEVAVSNLQYSSRIKSDPDVIFVPNLSGCNGKVSVAIPADVTGEGKVRLVYKGAVTEIKALSTDEVVLDPGTDVTVLQAWKDDEVMVKKI
ncbi:MAG: hypothetical protein IKT01_01900 [Eubacteriaceae bacterium]|nr:hypothetical protein [Eubacteriaceae bacterium]